MDNIFKITTINNIEVFFIIRLANDNDLKEIIEIEATCFPKAEAATEEQFNDRFKKFKDNFIVAEDTKTKKLIGFINGATTDKPELPDELYHNSSLHQADGNFQTVFGLDVLPDYRNRGVAGELIKHLIDISKKRGKKGVILTCKDNLVRYYEKFNFKHLGKSNSSHGGATWNDMLLTY